MPLYEYLCQDCETKFETLRPMRKADDPIQCKNCESMRTSRALSLFAAHVNNGGTISAVAGGGCSGGSCGNCGGGCGCGRH
jgi:putative FmdB family regulatory protein